MEIKIRKRKKDGETLWYSEERTVKEKLPGALSISFLSYGISGILWKNLPGSYKLLA